jgi:hypothetical protein
VSRGTSQKKLQFSSAALNTFKKGHEVNVAIKKAAIV